MFCEKVTLNQIATGILNVLAYNNKLVRTICINDEVWWSLPDVCSVLGLSSPSSVASRLTDREKMTLSLTSSHLHQRGGAQKLLIINLSGLSHLLDTSRKPAAKPFRHWAMATVIPSVCTNGGYIMGQEFMSADELTDAANQVTKNVLAERDRQIQRLCLQTEAQAALLQEWEPKVRYHDAVLQSPDAIPITVIAKDYGLSARALNAYLHDRGIQYKCDGTWVLYQRYAGKGYVHPETTLHDSTHCRQRLRWTQKGRMFLYEFLKSDGILPLSERLNVPEDIGGLWLP